MTVATIINCEGQQPVELPETQALQSLLSQPRRIRDDAKVKRGHGDAPLFHPHFGHWFRPELTGRTDQFDRLCSIILDQVVVSMERKRNLRQRDAVELRQAVDAVVANALGAFWHRDPKRVSYFRRHGAYADKARWPDWLSAGKLALVVSAMTDLGHLSEYRGECGQSSQFEATATFRALSDLCGVTTEDLTNVISPNRLVRMKDASKQLVAFEPTEETEWWKECLLRYNAFISGQAVGLDVSQEEECALLAAQRESVANAAICRPELFNRSLYRVFNDGTFDHGGRLYGGWWQSVPRLFRPKIVINGQPTVELDYSGFALRSIYHQTGIDYRDDPYELLEVCALAERQGLDRQHYRSSIKALTQALLNGTTGNPELIPLPHSFQGMFKRKQLFELLSKKHQPISWAFASGEGKRNQRLESDIALEIITFLTQAEVPVLPIHDSFIVMEKDQYLLECLMRDIYYHKFGYLPFIK